MPVMPLGDGAAASGLDRPTLPGPFAFNMPRICAADALTVAFAVISGLDGLNDLDLGVSPKTPAKPVRFAVYP